MKIIKATRILLSPLNWGIGHAARLVPIAHYMQAQGKTIFICSSGAALKLMRLECPYAQFIEEAPFEITYGKSKWTNVFKLMMQLPAMWLQVYREHQLLKNIVSKYKIEAVISDNRYGFYHDHVPCVFITHQLQIKVPLGSRLVNFINHYFIKKFDACWVPDWEANEAALAGELSRNSGLKNVNYIGPLSRAVKVETQSKEDAPLLYLLSGIEPQRSIFEEIILQRLAVQPHKAILVRGSSILNKKLQSFKDLEVYDFCEAKQLQNVVDQCKLIVARSGYSTMMDVVQWQKKAVFVPTSGQYEQVYLAHYVSSRKWFYTINQDDFLHFKETDGNGYQFPLQPMQQTNFEELLDLLI